jgi:hypothetical protein
MWPIYTGLVKDSIMILDFFYFIYPHVYIRLLKSREFWELDLFLSAGMGQGTYSVGYLRNS